MTRPLLATFVVSIPTPSVPKANQSEWPRSGMPV